MRRFLSALLIFSMFLPGLACAEIMEHGGKPQAPAALQMQDCHGTQVQAEAEGVMLFKDCMKADLQSAGDGPLLEKPVFALLSFAFLAFSTVLAAQAIAAAVNARPPPVPAYARRSKSAVVSCLHRRLRI